jgi:hypothetical protein
MFLTNPSKIYLCKIPTVIRETLIVSTSLNMLTTITTKLADREFGLGWKSLLASYDQMETRIYIYISQDVFSILEIQSLTEFTVVLIPILSLPEYCLSAAITVHWAGKLYMIAWFKQLSIFSKHRRHCYQPLQQHNPCLYLNTRD